MDFWVLKATLSIGGDLNGSITVSGCHATDEPLDICICGTINGTINLLQTGCAVQIPAP